MSEGEHEAYLATMDDLGRQVAYALGFEPTDPPRDVFAGLAPVEPPPEPEPEPIPDMLRRIAEDIRDPHQYGGHHDAAADLDRLAGLWREHDRVLVMNRAGGRVADVELDHHAFPEEGPTVWIDDGMASVIEDQNHGEFWAEAARLTSSTGTNGKGWTERTRPAILTFLRAQRSFVEAAAAAREQRPWTRDDIALVVEAAGLVPTSRENTPTAAMVAAHIRRRTT